MKKLLLLILFSATTILVTAQVKLDHKTPEQKLNEEYCSGMFKSAEGTILDVMSSNNASAYRNIVDWLDGRVAGFTVFTSRSGARIPLIRGHQPAVFVDEMPVHYNYLYSLPVTDIAMVKIIKTPFLGGVSGGNGAIAVYTISAEDEEEEENK